MSSLNRIGAAGTAMVLGLVVFATSAHAGEMANLVMLFSNGDAKKNAKELPKPICKLVQDCTQVAGAFLQKLHGDKKRLLLVLANTTVSVCHACTSDVSLVVHEGMRDQWQLAWRHERFTQWGDWGIVDPKEVRMHALPDGRKILALHVSGMHQGIISSAVELHLLDRGKLSKLGNFFTGCDSFGYSSELWHLEKWHVRLSLQDNVPEPILRLELRDELYGQDSVSTFRIGRNGLKPVGSTDKRLLPGGGC